MNEVKRHRALFKIVPLIALFLKLRFNYEYEEIQDVDGPYLLLANHNLELDPAFVGVAAKKHIYFVASEHVLRKGIATWLLMTFFKPIIHKKGKQGMNTIKEMLKAMKDGHNVCIFPEGNRSFNGVTGEILPSIGKVARRSGASLVTYRVEGGYFSQPRWGTTLRKGKMRGRVIKVYTPEELKTMTDQQVGEAVCGDLYEDAYETQKRERIAFKGKNLALGMEAAIFGCPKCKNLGGMHSDAGSLYCDCGFKAVYDVYGDLIEADGSQYTITQLDALQKELLREHFEAYKTTGKEAAFFSDHISMHKISDQHELLGQEEGMLEAYSDRIEICGIRILYSDLMGMAIYSRNSMIIHAKGIEGHLEVKSDMSFNALKYMYLYDILNES